MPTRSSHEAETNTGLIQTLSQQSVSMFLEIECFSVPSADPRYLAQAQGNPDLPSLANERIRANLKADSAMCVQRGALAHQIFTVGFRHMVSSIVPALSHSRLGIASMSFVAGELHLLKKLRFNDRPLLPVSLKVFRYVLSISEVPFGTVTRGDKTEALCC